MSFFEEVQTVSAVTVFSQLRAGGSALTQAFNDSKLGGALDGLFAGPHARFYQVAGKGLWYTPSDGTVRPPKEGQYLGEVVFFENPHTKDATYFIERTGERTEDGGFISAYAVCVQDKAKHGTGGLADTVMTISGMQTSRSGVQSPFEDVQFTDAQGVSGYNWQGLVILDQLLKSRPLARNPLWTTSKP